MANTQVDGIKKIERAELESSRQIVLAAIADEEKKLSGGDKPLAKEAKTVDSVTVRKDFLKIADKEKEVAAVNFLAPFKAPPLSSPPVLPVKAAGKDHFAIKKNAIPVIKPIAPDRRTELLLERKRQEEEMDKKLTARKVEELKRMEADRKNQQERAKQEKVRQEEGRKIIISNKEKARAEKKRLAAIKAEQMKAARRAFSRNLVLIAKNFFKNFRRNLARLFKIFANVIVLALVFLSLGYIVFALLLIKFNINNGLAKRIEKRLPVPAILSENGIIGYYDYLDIKNKTVSGDLASLKNNLAEYLLMADLTKRYGIKNGDTNSPAARDNLSVQILNDESINQVAKQRILKIKKLISAGGAFFEIATKFGDKYGKIDFTSAAEAAAKFGREAIDLKSGDVSDIIIADNGYYVVKRNSAEDWEYSFGYSYIKGKALADYLAENATTLKMWALVEVK